MKVFIGRLQQDLAVRIFSGITSGLIIILLGRTLPQSEFAHMQIFFSYGGIFYWICDFGLLGLAYISAAKGDIENFATNWKLRSRMILFAFIAVITSVLIGIFSLDSALLVLVGMQEVIVDAHLPIRQIMRSRTSNLLSVLVRKTMQCTTLIVLLMNNQSLNLNSIAFMFGFPTIFILISDFTFFARFPGALHFGNLRISAKYFFQSLGTGIASFDFSLIGHFGLEYLIYPYALGQKFARFISIPGQTYLQTVIRAEQEIGKNIRIFWRKMSKSVSTTMLFSSLALLVFLVLNGTLFGGDTKRTDLLVVITLILLPIGSTISSSLNGILVARSLFKFAAISTFVSSAMYLLLLWLGFLTHQIGYLVLVIGIVMNSITEILVCLYLIFYRETSKV